MAKKTRKFGEHTLYWVSDYHYKDDAQRRARAIKRLGHQVRVVKLPRTYKKMQGRMVRSPMRYAVYASRGYLPGGRLG